MNPLDISNRVKDLLNEKMVGIPSIKLEERIRLYHSLLESFYQFTHDAIKAEREACAQIADDVYKESSWSEVQETAEDIRDQIRKRGE